MKKLRSTPTILAAGIIAAVLPAPRVSGEKKTEEPKAPPVILEAPDTKPVPIETDTLPLKNLVLDADTQARQSLDAETTERYKEVILDARKAGQPNPMPAIDVVRDRDGKLYPFDGFHRIHAHKDAKEKEIAMNLFEPPEGWTGRDYAVLLSLGVNDTHGKPRTKKDQLRALKRALTHPEWSKWGNTVLASIVGCSEGTVRNHRSSFAPSERLVKRAGKVVTMKTGNIGRGKKAAKVKAAKASKKNAKAGKDGAEGATKAETANVSKAEQERRGNILKIADSQPTDKVGEVRKALEDDTLGLSAKDLKDWAMNSKSRILQITPLVIDKRWKPSRAIGFIDREFSGRTTLDELALMLLTRPDKRTETVAGLEISIHATSIEVRISTAPISH